ncbi:IMPACT family protein [Mycoplasmopsis gallinacea]|uniref:Proline dipeptidase pepQ n=1 Tax=Mycoplasmopsis gallinacea TaxID=29556 RepID=A0A449A2W2_9BACT|nr:YigZ family protein [Mycoplasmopsis gallinacea]VEU58596.1 proline dipeptidase pepQ [Mycoplasmopsis gallinacea]
MNLETLYEEKKSKFYGNIFKIKDKTEIAQIIEKVRKNHKKARHVCSAYLLNLEGVFQAGYDDDGEPKGTAGKAIYDLFQFKNISNVLVIVVRYFGGIKLGAGGLVRAYRKSAGQIIDLFLQSEKE